ncbi:MAG: hypothetical protein AUJ28_03945 [Parcubacteria group bacterium CG1_02_37_51]|uniref:Metal-dependent hydrolase n=2 Tax=Candidatus Komeiliibacteriota TaxID=1817908 RepID=A0A2M8DS69_9BACT|nr:MAG: hypothetical protein AUJ28_03945 [Parcubacteria group bacterium CG1_02_37_51]PIY95161.1 MAG: hypothetical protein COY67_01380 [Candidatus Komeilibacteria bacterium CG_4_10_14_0_8_um_filter_37_78]PJC02227.1 MAG: hypothetical protein CO073_00600 [Candidatus Komeilibacteria bacterium CG_4_9_14_0_8_um_filter_36_9]
MYLGTHLAAGLIIGKITGDYTPAILGSVIGDVDHLYSYYKHGLFQSVEKFIKYARAKENPIDDERNYLHNVNVIFILSLIIMVFNFFTGLVFLIAYLSHLLLDALDHTDFYPFWPNRKINLRGPINFFSIGDIAISIVLLMVWLII